MELAIQQREFHRRLKETIKNEVSPQQEDFQKRLKALMRKPENQICCDCSEKGPTWACIIRNIPIKHSSSTDKCDSIGGFCCFQCSGSHRRLGVHISFVRSVKLDEWKESEVEAMERGGNAGINEIYESNCTVKKPTGTSDLETRQSYIVKKFEQRLFVNTEIYNIAMNAPAVKKKFVNVGNHHDSGLKSVGIGGRGVGGIGQLKFRPKSSNMKSLVVDGLAKIICYNHCGKSRDLDDEEDHKNPFNELHFNLDATDVDSVFSNSEELIVTRKEEEEDKSLSKLVNGNKKKDNEDRVPVTRKRVIVDEEEEEKLVVDGDDEDNDGGGDDDGDSDETGDDKCDIEQTPRASNQRSIRELGQCKGTVGSIAGCGESMKEESDLFTITIGSGESLVTHKLTKHQMNTIASDLMMLSGNINSEGSDQGGECKEPERLSFDEPNMVRPRRKKDGNKKRADYARDNYQTRTAPASNFRSSDQHEKVEMNNPLDLMNDDNDCGDFESIWSSSDSYDSRNSPTEDRRDSNNMHTSRRIKPNQQKSRSRSDARDTSRKEQQELFDFESRTSNYSSGRNSCNGNLQQYGSSNRTTNAKVQQTRVIRQSGTCGRPREVSGSRCSNSKRDSHGHPQRTQIVSGRNGGSRPSNEEGRFGNRRNVNGNKPKTKKYPPNSKMNNQSRRPPKEIITRENERSRDERGQRRTRGSERGNGMENRREYHDSNSSENGNNRHSSTRPEPKREYCERKQGGNTTRQRTIQVNIGQPRNSPDVRRNDKKPSTSKSNRPAHCSRPQTSETKKREEMHREINEMNQDRELEDGSMHNGKTNSMMPYLVLSTIEEDESSYSNSLRSQRSISDSLRSQKSTSDSLRSQRSTSDSLRSQKRSTSNRHNLVEAERHNPKIDNEKNLRRSRRASMGEKINVSMAH